MVIVSLAVLLNVPVIIRSVKVFIPVALVIFTMDEIVEVPEIFRLHLSILFVAEVVNGPATLSVPVSVPVIVPPFITSPPAPTLVVLFDQLAVPLIVKEKQLPGLPFIVIVCPAQIITVSEAVGTAPVPVPQAVPHVAAVPQLPDALE